MRDVLESVGNPQEAFRSVHIAGTKGKGSTAIMLEAILRRAGMRTGLYTSPHLVHLFERIRIGRREIRESEFVTALNALDPAMRRLRPTFFEIVTAAAFWLFRRSRVEIAVVEVGLGGRLDATNVIRPEFSIITTIDYDHTELLGRTLAKIAGEKAGIVKPGVPVFTSERKTEPRKVIEACARKAGSVIARVGRELRIRTPSVRDPRVIEFVLEVDGRPAARIRLPMPGRHQMENAALAAAVALRLGVSRGIVERGLAGVRLPGRIERVARRPEVIVDVAHNPVSIRALRRALWPCAGRCWLVFGTSRDKDFRTMLRELAPATDVGLLTRARSPRAVPPAELARVAPFPSVTIGSVARAVRLALRRAAPRDRVLVAGSFYVAGEALEELRKGR